MIDEKVKSMQQIADTHAERITDALLNLQKLKTFPISEHSIQHLSKEQILYIEMLCSRFAKLQDFIGANVFDLFFAIEEEDIDGLTMIDKLNKLEKIGILSDAHIWREMRKARNIIEHEYPDNPLLMANTINEIVAFCPILLEIKKHIFSKINKDTAN